ncbi:hypothetical protein ACFFSH_34900 [Streptomyces filamentosus]|uniref:Uncharacterized protein n=1 Tax=Streptomyces filamentosus TaxID=67294 RepID=A0A919ER59_STRFL|nr:hypothetical protein [Streptomyces filamentosus]GHG15752.1 hypothetical protein GCM10017667_56700 [Streptomyces filamentosus]
MSNHEPIQGYSQPGQPPGPPPGHQPGPPPAPAYGPAYGGYGGQGGHGGPPGIPPHVPPPPGTPPGRSPSSHRGAWIGAAATLAAAVIGVVGTYLVSGNKETPQAAPPSATTAAQTPAGEDGPTTATTPQEETPTADTPSENPSGTASETPSGPPPGTVRWQGPLVIAYAEGKDLDAAPPVPSEINSDNDFAVYPFGDHMLRPDNGAKALVWEGEPKTPSHADCAGVVDTLGTSNDIALKTGLTVCGRTRDGHLVRLTVKKLDGLASATNGTFDVVVWNG